MNGSLDWERVSELFEGALAVPPEELGAWLDRECGEDATLRNELESLLRRSSDSEGFLDRLKAAVVGPLADGAIEGTAPRLPTGMRLGTYEVLDVIGEGGTASVYLARDTRHNRDVALKVLRPQLSSTLGRQRFLREIEIAAALSHPHVLPVFDSGEVEGLLFYVTPYVEGESLRRRLEREKRLPVGEAVRLTEQVASALSHAHKQGVVHRDIKPENILLSGDQAVVADFGIAHALEAASSQRLTATGLAIGTPAYMSPEQALGTDVDARTDIYALGCVLYEMVTGSQPFTASTPRALLAKHVGRAASPMRSLDSTIPVFVERAVERALAKDPADRFATPADFSAVLAEGTVVARSGRSWVQRSRTLAGATVLSLAVAAWWASGRFGGGPRVETVAVVPRITGDTAQDLFVRDVFRDLTTELAKVGVRVKSDGAVMPYLDEDLSISRIGSELGVEGVVLVEATLEDGVVFSELQLVDAATQDLLWGDDFSGEERRIGSLLGEMTLALSDQVGGRIGPEERARYGAAPETDPAVLDALRRADFYWEQLTEESLETALAYYQLALDRDHTSAEAWSGVAQIWMGRAQQGLVSSEEARAMAEPALDSALHYDPMLAGAQATLAERRVWSEWNWEGGRKAFEAALTSNPADATTRAYYSLLLLYLGEYDESLAEIERARGDEPPNSLIQSLYGQNLNSRGRWEDARDALLGALDYNVGVPQILSTLRTTYHLLGEYDSAIESWRASFSAEGSYQADRAADGEALAILDGYTGGRESYEETLTGLAEFYVRRSATEHVTPWRIGTLYARAHDVENAIEYLSRAVREHDQNSPYLSVEDTFDFLRDDPRFQELILEMGLPLHKGSAASPS